MTQRDAHVQAHDMDDARKTYRQGLLYAVLAYLLWGLLPVYFRAMGAAPPLELLASRVIWSFGLLMFLIIIQREIPQVIAAISHPRTLGALSVSSVLIGANWFIYILAVDAHQVVAASLGYFLNPLVSVLLGVTFLRERLSRGQWVAIALAAAGVFLLAANALSMLWLSLSLAVSFALYGFVRKLIPASSLTCLAVETGILLLPALFALRWVNGHQGLAFGTHAAITIGLIASGAITSVPLLLFGGATQRLPIVTLGLLQYLAPTIQFLTGVFLFGERMTVVRWASFALIWSGVAYFVGRTLRDGRRASAAV